MSVAVDECFCLVSSCRYFQCLPKFGLFAPIHKVIRIGFPSTSPAKAKKSKRVAMGVSSLAHSPSSSSISSVSSVASSVGGRPSRAGLVSRLLQTESGGWGVFRQRVTSSLKQLFDILCLFAPWQRVRRADPLMSALKQG